MKLNLILFFSALFNIVTIYAGTTSVSQGEQFLEKSKRTISFTENKGQVRDQNWQPRQDILFSGNAGGLIYHLKADGLHYQLNKIESWKEEDFSGKGVGKQMIPNQVSSYRVDVNWIGANKNAQIIKAQELAGYDNFYNVPEGVEPALFVKSYRSITYKNIYDGIDLHFYEGEHGGIEYDFIVQPGADYKQIQLEINGGELAVTPKNELVIKTPFGDIIEGSLRVFQNDKEITSNWLVSDNRIAFKMENYNPLLSMRIDPPVRLWGTYYGGLGRDFTFTTSVSNNGTICLAGSTMSLNSISTVGSHQETINDTSSFDAFITIFNSNGERLWSTYYGGNLRDDIFSSKIDSLGNIYVVGTTESYTNISFNLLSTHSGGQKDAFVAKFDINGIIIWGLYHGGSSGNGNDIAFFCDIDDKGNVYVTGSTGSTNFPTTSMAYQSVFGGDSLDVFISIFDTYGNRLWGTLYGGSGNEEGSSISVNSDGSFFVSGYTSSMNFISSAASHQEIYGGGSSDAFIVKFDSNYVREWATYFGGTGDDYSFSVGDDFGNVYLTGSTTSYDNISTTNSYQSLYSGMEDAFLAKFNLDGEIEWSTYYGGTYRDYSTSCATSNMGYVYIYGYTNSLDSISSTDTYQNSIGGSNDVFLAEFRRDGSRTWATYYGGYRTDNPQVCVVDNDGFIYFSGITRSDTGLVIVNPISHQPNFGGWDDAFLVKFKSCYSFSDFSITACNSYTSPSGNYIWNVSGLYNDTIPNSMGCDSIIEINLIIDSTDVTASYFSYIDPLDSLNLIVVNTSTGNISSYLWDFGDGNTSTLQYPQHTYATVGNYQICLTVSDSNCSKTYCDSAIVSKSGGIISISVIAPVITSAENINLTDGILIYPNPTNDYVILQLSQSSVKDYSITLMNVLGEVISVQQLTTSITKIDLPKTSDIYFIKVDSERENKIFKVIKH